MVASVFVGSKAEECESDHASSLGTIEFMALTASSTVLPHANRLTSSIHPNPQVDLVSQAGAQPVAQEGANPGAGGVGEAAGFEVRHYRVFR
ncbi:hypothetical protein NBRC10513_006805 [Rhodotorula toruloides]